MEYATNVWCSKSIPHLHTVLPESKLTTEITLNSLYETFPFYFIRKQSIFSKDADQSDSAALYVCAEYTCNVSFSRPCNEKGELSYNNAQDRHTHMYSYKITDITFAGSHVSHRDRQKSRQIGIQSKELTRKRAERRQTDIGSGSSFS